MANRRMVHRKISLSTQLADVSDLAKLAFTWGILHTDDWGIINADPRRFRGEVLPLHDATPGEVGVALDELVRVQLVVRYTAQGSPFLCYPSFDKHQEGLRRRTATNRHPPPVEADPGSVENEHLLPDDFREIPGNPRNYPRIPSNSRKFPPT